MTSPIYVERVIRVPMEELWRATQRPEVHERWDLRFTEIRYLERKAPSDPQRFLYATRIGLGLRIAGEGESVGEVDRSGERTSALRFWSGDAKSLIREGSGYWRYIPVDGGVRFITLYDYKTRFGAAGGWFDRIVFRPLLGWATAWSFDRLRLWLESGIDPATSLERSAIHWLSRLALAFVWLYHGVVPKLVASAGEIDLATRIGIPAELASGFVTVAALGEIALGLALLVAPDARVPLVMSGLLGIALAIVTGVREPSLLVAPFQPVTLGIAMAGLAAVGVITAHDLPQARTCLRRVPAR